jgi:ABC-2 type transport system ATP-binding protein
MSLIIENISISYQNANIIENLSFKVENGEVIGIAGINGAGKSTTLKSLVGLIPMLKGRILVNGKEATSIFDKEELKAEIGYCPDVGGIIPSATPREHVNILLNLNRKNNKATQERAIELLKLVKLYEHIDTPCGSFSHGMMRRMSVVLASLNASKVLILDEPFDGVDPTGIKSIQGIINQHRSFGHSVIVSSHLINVLSETADKIIVMTKGSIISEQDAKKFKGDKGIKYYSKLLGI